MSEEKKTVSKKEAEDVPSPHEKIISNLYTASDLLVRMTAAAENTLKTQEEELKVIEEIKGIMEEFGRSAEKMKEIKALIDYMDTLSKAVAAQQGNIDALITALGKFAEDHKQIKETVKKLGSGFRIGEEGDAPGGGETGESWMTYYSAAVSTATFFALLYLFFFS